LTRAWQWPSARSASLTLPITHSLTSALRPAIQAAPLSVGYSGLKHSTMTMTKVIKIKMVQVAMVVVMMVVTMVVTMEVMVAAMMALRNLCGEI